MMMCLAQQVAEVAIFLLREHVGQRVCLRVEDLTPTSVGSQGTIDSGCGAIGRDEGRA